MAPVAATVTSKPSSSIYAFPASFPSPLVFVPGNPTLSGFPIQRDTSFFFFLFVLEIFCLLYIEIHVVVIFMELQRSVYCLLVLSGAFCLPSEARQFVFTWSQPSGGYEQWSSKQRFQVNDTVLFWGQNASVPVLQVSQDDYNSCNTSTPIATVSGSPFLLPRSGPFYFISGDRNGCLNSNQRMKVVVLSERRILPPSAPKSSPPGVPVPAAAPPPFSPPALSPPSNSPAFGPPTRSSSPVLAPGTSAPANAPVSLSPSRTPVPVMPPVSSPGTTPSAGTPAPVTTHTASPPASAPTASPPASAPTASPPASAPTASPPAATPSESPPVPTPIARPPASTPSGSPPASTPSGSPAASTPSSSAGGAGNSQSPASAPHGHAAVFGPPSFGASSVAVVVASLAMTWNLCLSF